MTDRKRIQLRRAKGWRMPENTVKVDRSTPWGNPFEIGKDGDRRRVIDLFRKLLAGAVCVSCRASAKVLNEYRVFAKIHIDELAGHDLACWCRLCEAHRDGLPFDVDCADCPPCHADDLGKVANGIRVYRLTTEAT